MALDWDVSEIVAREGHEFVWPGDQLAGVIECLIWATMAVGMNRITADNWPTFAARLRAWEHAVRPFPASGQPIPVAMVRRCIGLRTNASAMTLAAFERHLGKAALAHAKRKTEKEALRRAEATEA